MARPRKIGLDYFPFDSDFFKRRKIRGLFINYGYFGIALYIYLLCEIYIEEGYYLYLDEEDEEVMCFEMRADKKDFSEFMKYCTKRAIFDKKLWEESRIVTSKKIQEVYQAAKKRIGHNLILNVDKEKWLLTRAKTADFIEILNKTEDKSTSEKVSNDSNSESFSEGFTAKNPQIKEKENKINIKEKEIKELFESSFSLTPNEKKLVERFIADNVPEDVMRYAVYEALKGGKPCVYALKIINNKIKEGKKPGASYDLEEFEKNAWNVPK